MGLLAVGAGAALIAAVLYWLMQPTVLPNPGLAGYHAPMPDPILPRVTSRMTPTDTYRAEVELAKRENELIGEQTAQRLAGATGKRAARSAFAKARDNRRQTDSVRTARTPRDGWRAWAWGNTNWGTW
jgi:hypothetical protein